MVGRRRGGGVLLPGTGGGRRGSGGRGPLLGEGDLGVVAAAVGTGTAALGPGTAAALRVVAGPGVVADLLPHLLGDVRRLVGHLDQLAAAGVAGHLHDPAGPDEAGLGQLGAVRLHAVLVELEDLLVPAPVAEVPVGDLPEGVVVTAFGRLDPVVLRVAVRGRAAVGAGGCLTGLLGEGARRPGGLLLLLREDPRRLLRRRHGGLLVPLHALPELRQPRREAGRGGADQQQRGDELPGEQLAGPGPRHPPRHPDAGQRGLDLDEHAGGELRPGEPDDDGQDVEEGLDGDLTLQPVQTRRPVRQRPADLRGQREGHPDDQDEQHDEGEERLDEVPERPPPHPHRLRRPVPRCRRGSRRACGA